MPRKFRCYVPKGASRKATESAAKFECTAKLSNDVAVQADELITPTSEAVVQTDKLIIQTNEIAVQTDDNQQPLITTDVAVQTDKMVVAEGSSQADELHVDVAAPDDDGDCENICTGNNDEKFFPLIQKHRGIFKNSKGTGIMAYYDQRYNTIRHVNCSFQLPLSTSGSRCSVCRTFRDNILRSALTRMLKESTAEDPCSTSSHVNFRYLNTPEKLERMRNLSKLVRVQHKQLSDLRKKLEIHVEANSIRVDESTHHDLLQIMESNDAQQMAGSDESFSTIFWQQQLKAAKLKNSKQMRWHPAMIRWCLYLNHRSSGCYSTLRNSGVIKLPSQRTLSDYRHSSPSVTGFSVATDLQLLEALKNQKPAHLAKYVSVIFDEMYIKEGLVFEKYSGALVGYQDLGEINNILGDAERQFNESGNRCRPLAKVMLVFMVRGLFTSMKFTYAQFPAASTKGAQLFPLFRTLVCRLTRLGINVVAATCDGASDNRMMFSLHDHKMKGVYKTSNVYSKHGNPIFFISDPPHLIKTIRNCFQRGKLWCNGSAIDWKLIIELYHRNTGAQTATPGLSLVPKLKYEHVYLTSFSKMRVDLAAQVLSSTVANAVKLTGATDANETANFIEKMDKFFDCLNVSSFTAGKRHRKPFQQPYRGRDDFRISFLKEVRAYLDLWESTVQAREGFNNDEKKKMILSSSTANGMRMTISSFSELVPHIFGFKDVTCFLSEKLSQDPLEKFFGCQRQRGATNENPKVSEFLKNTQSLRVIDSIQVSQITGNCRGCKRKSYDLESVNLNKPLKKRRRHCSA